ncbi:MAG: M48 family metallopeptidase [Candidatus Omnitrophica bacterium]|nr:M48 family metallopeptidase [Candidatus Omnitrophota bacterium]
MTETDKASKLKGLAWVIGAVGLAVVLGSGITPFVRAIPWSWEKGLAHSLGSTTYIDACRGNEKQEALLKQLVTRLYPLDRDDRRFSLDVQVVNNPEINAFAELGGKISINRGLLEKAQSPEEVAGVLAHEITHVGHRHILEGFVVHLMTIGGIQMVFGGSSQVKWTNFFLKMGFTRSQETEADEGGLARLQKAHINNQGFKDFFERMKDLSVVPAVLSDHPADEERSRMAARFPTQDPKPVMTDEEWKSFKSFCQ